MRQPVNPVPGMQIRTTSMAVSLTVDAFEQAPANTSVPPLAQLDCVDGTLTDDASQFVQRTMTLNVAKVPSWLKAGMWIRPTIGIQNVQPIGYRLPTLIIEDITYDLAELGGGTLVCADPAAVLNGRPYETDTTLSGTLRALVSAACTLALSRPTDVTGVPAVPIPIGTIAEFGRGRWDVCVEVAEALGIVLRFTDAGDVIGTYRNALPPSPAAFVERSAGEGGTRHTARAPTAAKVLVTRGLDTVGLIGSAVAGTAPPAWYLSYVVTDRQEGDATTTQAQADTLASNMLKAKLADLDTFESLPILGSPWLEAGVDVVTYLGQSYWVRALSLHVPSLATAVTLRRIV